MERTNEGINEDSPGIGQRGHQELYKIKEKVGKEQRSGELKHKEEKKSEFRGDCGTNKLE